MKALFLVKEIKTKTLVSGDKSARILLETTSQEDVDRVAKLSNLVLAEVEISENIPTTSEINYSIDDQGNLNN